MEFNPEVFAQVTMLYVNMDVGTSLRLTAIRTAQHLQCEQLWLQTKRVLCSHALLISTVHT